MGQIKNIKLHIVTDIKRSRISISHFIIMSLVVPNQFQHILRVMNTNIDGKTKIMYAMTSIKGVGRRFFENLLPTPLIDVIAYMIFVLPSMLVFITRRMCWNWFGTTRDMMM